MKHNRSSLTAAVFVGCLLAPFWPGVAESDFSAEERAWWAYQPLGEMRIPEAENRRWGTNPIDRFVYSALLARGLEPSPEAGKAELIRRVYFDLVGLPPSEIQLDAFLKDGRPGAYQEVVDKLLASPNHGERWAQHWLDLVRYAESDGYRADAYRADAWPYRDYVIRSFNGDKPYDQFVREQLAGDEIAPNNPDVLVATGFLRHGIYEWNQRDVRAHWDAIVNEVTDVTGDVFLGLSFQCARCHDHKFDPILQADYFRLKAFFSPLAWRDDLKLATEEQRNEYERKFSGWEMVTKEIRSEMESIVKDGLGGKLKGAREKFPEDIQEMMLKTSDERTPFEEQLARLANRQLVYERERFNADSVKGEAGERYKELVTELAKFNSSKPPSLRPAFVATDVRSQAPPTRFKGRRGEVEVEPGYLTIIGPGDAAIPRPGDVPSTGRRLALANWITRPDNPLTARVMVNRVWQSHFGNGLVATPSDFGKLGEGPSHPELLDWLARTFVEEGWSLKKLHRRIVTSATYRQTARREPGEVESMEDPMNRMLWRFSPKRLDSGQARDALLHASGELQIKEGGPSLGGDARCRTVYLRKIRNTPHEFIRQFDGPAGFSSAPMRSSTTTPMQSLLMINSEWSMARSRAMADGLLKANKEDLGSVVRSAYLRLFGRQPVPAEVEEGIAFVHEIESEIESAPKPERIDDEPVLADAGRNFARVKGIGARAFPFDGKKGRLEITAPTDEGNVFTVEAIINLTSLYPDASVRTIVSRWNGGAKNLGSPSQGWSLGITSEKSRYEPRNLIVQLVGEDFQGNVTYEVVASDLRIPVGKPYYVAAVISTRPTAGNKTGGTVTFFARDLEREGSELQVSTVEHPIRSGLHAKARKLVVGGRDQGPRSMFHGEMARLMISGGIAMNEEGIPFSGGAGKTSKFELVGEGDLIPDGVRWMPFSGGSSSRPTLRPATVRWRIFVTS